MKKKLFLLTLIYLLLPLHAQYYGKNKIQPEKIDWNYMQTMHFDIYYPAGDNNFGRIVALCAEEAYYYLRNDLKTPVKNRIPVIFYSTHQEFESTNIIPNLLSEGVGGFTESMNNRIAMPFSGSYREMEKTLIHEMTHAYVNELSRDHNGLAGKRSLPFWFSEGLPEFLSVNGKSTYNNMFIIDLIYNNNLINLSEVSGYYAYREGESFLTFIEKEFGREKVIEIFYSSKSSSQDEIMKRIFNLSFLEIQQRWESSLKKEYFKRYNDFDVPAEVMDRKTEMLKDGSSRNIAPRFSPDGIGYAWFSNRKLTEGIWYSDGLEQNSNQEMVRCGIKGNLEEFHYKRNNLSWFPEGDRIAFAANTSFGDRIHILNIETNEIIRSVSFDSVKVIYELDVSPDGKKLVFSGIKSTEADIYIYDLQTGILENITDDRFYEGAPRWSHDGKKIAFYSERIPFQTTDNLHLFDHSVRNIYYYDLQMKKFFQVTENSSDCYHPVWNNDDSMILYLSDEDFITDIYAADLKLARKAKVTSLICGVLNFDLSSNDQKMLLSVFNNGSWDIYQDNNPLDSLEWKAFHFPRKVEMEEDFWETYNIDRIKYFGKTNLAFKKPGPRENIDPELAAMYDIQIDYGPDTPIVKYNRQVDRRPTLENAPSIKPYKLKWKIDNFWGGLAYNSSGTYALLNIWASDILGNHSLYSSFNVSGEIENSSFNFQYLDLTGRNDYGGGVFYLNDETIWLVNYDNGTNDYFRERDRQYGIMGILKHPLDKYWRLDWQLAFLRHQTFRDWWDKSADKWINKWLPQSFIEQFNLKTEEDRYIIAPSIYLIHDNTLYGNVGPIAGGKQYLSFQHSFSTGKSYNIAYADLRKYLFFARRYSWANRLLLGWKDSDETSGFELTGFNGVRGFDDENLEGNQKILCSTELRFPLLKNLSMEFPFPIRMYNVRGSAFLDVGAVWSENKDLVISKDGRLQDAIMGLGMGPRLNMGFFILKFDIAWETDLRSTSKPRYYLWLIEDF